MTDVERRPAGTVRAGAGWGWILAYGVVSILAGLFAFLAPLTATLAATLVFAAFLIAIGAMSLLAGLFGRGHAGRGYSIVLGVLALVGGLMTAFQPVTGAISITVLVAVWLAVRGVVEIGFGLRQARHKVMMIALGVLNLVLAGLIFATVPFSALTLPGFILGLSFLLGGIAAVTSALGHRKGAPAFAVPS